MDSIDYYDRYAVPYYEETVDLSMEEQLERFMAVSYTHLTLPTIA